MTSGSLRVNNKAWCQESVFLKKCIYSVLLITFYVLFCMDILWIVFAFIFLPSVIYILLDFLCILFLWLGSFSSFTAEFFRLLLSWHIVNIIYSWISAVFRLFYFCFFCYVIINFWVFNHVRSGREHRASLKNVNKQNKQGGSIRSHNCSLNRCIKTQ